MVLVMPVKLLHMYCAIGIFSQACGLLPPSLGSWGRQIAQVHLPVGHEAASGNAASPSVSEPCPAPAVFLAADMGVGAPMRGPQAVFIVARLVHSELDPLLLSWWLWALSLRWRRRSMAASADMLKGFFTDLTILAVFVDVVGQVIVLVVGSAVVHAELMSHRCGARRQSGVEVLLPRAVLNPRALSM